MEKTNRANEKRKEKKKHKLDKITMVIFWLSNERRKKIMVNFKYFIFNVSKEPKWKIQSSEK
jgi:hypothetical protein